MKTTMMGLGLVLVLLSSGLTFAEESAPNAATQEEGSKKFCPVCGPEEEMEGLSVSYKYKGQKYSFCSMDCLKAFKENPEKYLKVEAKS